MEDAKIDRCRDEGKRFKSTVEMDPHRATF